LRWSSYFFRVMWFLGLIFMVTMSYELEIIVQRNSSSSFQYHASFWYFSVAPTLFGIYLSLLFIKRWSVKINMPLLLGVSVPCLALTLYSPVIYTIVTMSPSYSTVPIPFWLMKISQSGMFSMISAFGGFSLFIALFSSDRVRGLR